MADLFSLIATIGLDSSNFIAGIGSAQALFNSFANAVVGFSRDVMNTGMNFDQAMANVASVLGEQEGNVENMNRLRAYAREQARESIYTAEEAADAYYYMGMAGWKSEQMMAGLPGIMSLAAASGENLATVSDIVTDSLTAFGLTADDTQRYVDILAQTATNANTNVALMGETFKYVAPIAGTLGADVDDVAWTIGLMADAGVKGSMAGTALRQIFTRISTDAGASSEQLGALGIITEELGVQFRDNEGKMRDWGEVIADIRVKWAELSEEQQVAYAKQIASERGMAGWLVLMGRSEEDVKALGVAIDDAADAAQNMANTRLDSLAGDVTLFNSALYDLKIAIYEGVKAPLRDVVQWGTGAINEITKAIDENGLAGGIEVLGAKIEEAGEKFAPLLESIGKAAGPLVTSLFETILPKLKDAGVQLAAGLAEGLSQGLSGGGIVFQLMSGLLGGIVNPGDGEARKFDLTALLGEGQITAEVIPQLKTTQIQDAIDKAQAEGETMVTIDGFEFPTTETAEQIAKELGYIGLDAATPLADGLYSEAINREESFKDGLKDTITDAGTFGGKRMADNIDTQLTSQEAAMRDDLAAVLGAAGTPAGQAIANSIGTELSSRTYSINVQANVSGLPAQRNASAMTSGRIFSRATVFGFANGQYQIAGDAGPEAVVGTGSLVQMIQSAVRGAMGGQAFTTPRAGGAPRNIVIPLYIDGREFARAEVPFIDAEYQRVGLSLVTR